MRDNEYDLKRFSDLENVEVAKDDPDVRGWDVVSADGRDIGEVKDLLVDTSTMKVRSLEVELEGSSFNWSDNRRVAVPVDAVRLDRDHDHIVVNGMGYEEIGRLRPYPEDRAANYTAGGPGPYGGQVPGETIGNRPDVSPGPARDRLTRSEEEVRVGKREVEAGEVRVGKHVETERVSQPVTRKRETVNVERRPVSDERAYGDAEIGEDEIRVPLTEEELIVEKRPVVKEELVISKSEVEETETVDTEVRKERFDVQEDASRLPERDRHRKGGI